MSQAVGQLLIMKHMDGGMEY